MTRLSREDLQRYYKSCGPYFDRLREKDFDAWFSKYYKFLSMSKKKGWVLDVGCGTGQVTAKLAELGVESVGVDVSPIAIRLGVRDSKKSPEAFFLVASAYNLPFREEVFGVVGCFDLLEHLHDPKRCLREMLRAVRKKGTIITASPNLLCPYYARGLKGMMSSLRMLFLKIVKASERLSFEHVEPRLDWSGKEVGRDLDASTVIDPLTLKEALKEHGVKLTYQSSYLGSNLLLEKLSTLPLLRIIGGGVFIAATKNDTSPAQSTEGAEIEG